MQEVLLPVIGISAIIGVAALCAIVVRFANAFARRLEARAPGMTVPDPAIAELREELDAVHERLDFVERALVAQKDHPERALPPKEDRPGVRPRTPA